MLVDSYYRGGRLIFRLIFCGFVSGKRLVRLGSRRFLEAVNVVRLLFGERISG